ncbi:MAG: glycosyltransferase family 4 protein [Chloroflexota bacterium]|nr:glycosyltransferase family 4 protein [Chloroflexota bacterium]
MRFGFVTYGLDRPLSGISRSVLELGRALGRRADCQPVFVTPYRNGPFTTDEFTSVRVPGARLLPALMSWGAVQLPFIARRQALPLIHDPAGVSPFVVSHRAGRYKRIVTLHDAIAFRYPEGYTRLNNFLHRQYVPATLRNVDAVITVSEDSRKDLVHFLQLPPHKVFVVPNAAGPAFRPLPSEVALETARRYGAAPPFILYVGALEARKNVPTLLHAFARLRPHFPEVTLVICGQPTWKFAEIPKTLAALDLASSVRFTGFVADADLPALYNAAAVFCFPSFYEGFGLPVLEAMACGTPVVCSKASSLPEVAGDAALLVEPSDIIGLADALAGPLADQALAASLRERGLARAATFSWARAAELTLGVYRHVLGQEHHQANQPA